MINNRHLVLLGTALLFLCPRSQAQSSDPIRASTESLPDGRVLVHVRNLSPHAITAVAVVGKRIFNSSLTNTSARFFDCVLSPRRRGPLVLGESADFNFFGPHPPPEQTTRSVEVKAVLFASGESWGDPGWVSKLLNRRTYVQAQVLSVLDEIAEMTAANATREDVMQRLQGDRDKMIQNGRDVDEKQMADVTFSNVLLTVGQERQADGSAILIRDALNEATRRLTALKNGIEQSKPAIGQ